MARCAHRRKTHKGLQKRVKITAKGKVRRKQSFRGHLLSGRSAKRLRKLRQSRVMAPGDAKKVIEALGV
ncbi:MAG TPA: 50S ribosomal protein L35 [Phycisphaerae bacterium]|nr:50S ribosomal protein L35 [Phycisphaerae bacterium]HOW72482.1 50S ribosomal protein L35 [Phycisphaerae bacterium]HRY70268.1 50S ribosomal protein L35 [Phycisphaerae bacterium]HSA27561.1 50S ribosomal protein L35 [Phycisphaerae bacterium]